MSAWLARSPGTGLVQSMALAAAAPVMAASLAETFSWIADTYTGRSLEAPVSGHKNIEICFSCFALFL